MLSEELSKNQKQIQHLHRASKKTDSNFKQQIHPPSKFTVALRFRIKTDKGTSSIRIRSISWLKQYIMILTQRRELKQKIHLRKTSSN